MLLNLVTQIRGSVLTVHFTIYLVYQSISLEKSVGNDLF